MAYSADGQRVDIPWPAKGIDLGTAFAAQSPGTCVDALNVRTYDLRNRQSGGKRSGLKATFTEPMVGSPRVQGIIPVRSASGLATGSTTPEMVTLEASDFVDADPIQFANNGDLADWYSFGVESSVFKELVKQATTPAVDSFQPKGSTTVGIGWFIAYQTTNDITIELHALDTATGSDGSIVDGEPLQIGPVIRGGVVIDSHIMACIRYVSANVVRLDIIHVDEGSYASIPVASSANVTLNGTGSRVTANCVIRLREEGDNVVARWTWVGAGAAGADIDVTVTATPAMFAAQSLDSYQGNNGGGFATFDYTNDAGWDLVKVSYTKLVPASANVLLTFDPTTFSTSPNGQRYYLPSNWSFTHVDTSLGTATTTDGQATDTALSNDEFWVDTNDSPATLVRSSETSQDFTLFHRTSSTFTAEQTVAVRYRPSWADYSGVLGDEIGAGAAFLLSPDKTSFLCVIVNDRGGGSAVPTVGEGFNVQTIACIGGTVTTLDSVASAVDIQFGSPSNTTQEFEIRYVNGVASVLRNGQTVYSYTLSASNLTTIASIIGNTDVAFCSTPRTSDLGGPLARFSRVQFLEIGGANSQAQTNVDVALFSSAATVEYGRLGGATTQATGSGLNGTTVNGFTFNGKVYAVDGQAAVVVDLSAGTVDPWDGDANLNPDNEMFALAALFRGRAVLARTPTNPSLWWMSQQFNPNNFDTGATPEATAAVAGTLTSGNTVGGPSEPIVALIVSQDDRLFFAGQNSISVLDGDPGYNGVITPLSEGVGILGPRAWVFDDQDRLWFVGSSGLYVIPRGGSEPGNVSGRRLASLLDMVDIDTTFVQVAYDAFKKHLHIFLTPTSGLVQGEHVVYDTVLDAFWKDQFPLAAGPWSVASIVGNSDEDRRVLMGGNDGIVRRFDDATFFDIGENGSTNDQIDSYVKFGPIEGDSGWSKSMITEFQMQGASDNGTLSVEFYQANTPEELEDTTFGDGTQFSIFGDSNAYQGPRRMRLRGGAHQVSVRQLSNVTRWSMERLRIILRPGLGRRRAGG